jgi:hypothetical protein
VIAALAERLRLTVADGPDGLFECTGAEAQALLDALARADRIEAVARDLFNDDLDETDTLARLEDALGAPAPKKGRARR